MRVSILFFPFRFASDNWVQVKISLLSGGETVSRISRTKNQPSRRIDTVPISRLVHSSDCLDS